MKNLYEEIVWPFWPINFIGCHTSTKIIFCICTEQLIVWAYNVPCLYVGVQCTNRTKETGTSSSKRDER